MSHAQKKISFSIGKAPINAIQSTQVTQQQSKPVEVYIEGNEIKTFLIALSYPTFFTLISGIRSEEYNSKKQHHQLQSHPTHFECMHSFPSLYFTLF